MRLIILLAAPMAIGNLFQQLYNVVDSAMVGKLVGSDALAAVGASGNITFLFLRFVTESVLAEALSPRSILERAMTET